MFVVKEPVLDLKVDPSIMGHFDLGFIWQPLFIVVS